MIGLRYQYKEGVWKHAFLMYVQETHPTWTLRTCQTCVSDALYIEKFLSPNEQQAIVEEIIWGPSLEDFLMHILIQNILVTRKNPKKDAKGYLRSFRVYFTFIQIIKLIEIAKLDKPRDIRKGDIHGDT